LIKFDFETLRFGWEPLYLTDIDTFPGANELHKFVVSGPTALKYQIIGYTHERVVIICAVGRKA
jgi:hypothetical protein